MDCLKHTQDESRGYPVSQVALLMWRYHAQRVDAGLNWVLKRPIDACSSHKISSHDVNRVQYW